jgi:MFS family permease
VSAGLRRSFSSLRIPNYRRYFAGQLVSLSGNWVQIVAEMWLILSLTGSGAAVGITSALQFLPILLFGAWGGVLADRFAKRRLLIVTQAAMTVPALSLWALTAGGAIEPWMVYGLVFARGAVNAVDNPTRQSFVIEMVGKDRVVNAVGLNSVLIHAARIVGPAAAGTMIATIGVAPCFLVNALSFAAMIVALRTMDASALRPATQPRGPGGVGAAIRYVAANRELAIPLAMMAVVGTLAFNFQVILPLLARFAFDGGAPAYTALAVAMGAGSVAGALFTAARARVGNGHLIATAIGFGALALLAAAAPSLPVAIVALVPLGAFTVSFAAGINSVLQLRAEPSMRGRVMALYTVVFLGSTPIGGPLVGWLSELAGARFGLVLGGVAALSAAVGGWLAFSDRSPSTLLDVRRRWRLGMGRAIAIETGGADQLHRLERGRGLDVEPNAVALLDGGNGGLAGAPRERDQDPIAGADRGNLRPGPTDAADDQRKGTDRPQAQKRDPARRLRREAGRGSRPGEGSRHRLRGARRAPEPDTQGGRCEPPARADDECRGIGVAVGGDDTDRAEGGRHAPDEQHGQP